MANRKFGEVTIGNATVKMYSDSEWNVFRCVLYVNGVKQPDADYETSGRSEDDRNDCYATAHNMAKRANTEPVAKHVHGVPNHFTVELPASSAQQ